LASYNFHSEGSYSGDYGFDISEDGLHLYYALNVVIGTVYEMSLSTAWDLTTMSFVRSVNLTSNTVDVVISPNGNYIMCLSNVLAEGHVSQWKMNTPFSLGSVSYIGGSIEIDNEPVFGIAIVNLSIYYSPNSNTSFRKITFQDGFGYK